MTLSDLASVGSFVSGAAVAISLILLLFQMRQNDKTLRATMQQSRTARYAEQILRPTEPYLCEAVTRAAQGDLTMDSFMIMAFVRHTANLFWNFRAFVDSLISETKAALYPDPAATWKTLLTAELEKAAPSP